MRHSDAVWNPARPDAVMIDCRSSGEQENGSARSVEVHTPRSERSVGTSAPCAAIVAQKDAMATKLHLCPLPGRKPESSPSSERSGCRCDCHDRHHDPLLFVVPHIGGH